MPIVPAARPPTAAPCACAQSSITATPAARATSVTASMSPICPYRCTGTTARVRGDSAPSSEPGSIVPASGSTSQSTGVAPARAMAATVGTQVFAWVTTSSPSPMPAARRISSIASVPDAHPTACDVPAKAANSRSKSSPSRPSRNHPLSSTRAMAASSSERSSSTVRRKFAKGTRMVARGYLADIFTRRASALRRHAHLQPRPLPRGLPRQRGGARLRPRARGRRRRLDRSLRRTAPLARRPRTAVGERSRSRPDPRCEQGDRDGARRAPHVGERRRRGGSRRRARGGGAPRAQSRGAGRVWRTRLHGRRRPGQARVPPGGLVVAPLSAAGRLRPTAHVRVPRLARSRGGTARRALGRRRRLRLLPAPDARGARRPHGGAARAVPLAPDQQVGHRSLQGAERGARDPPPVVAHHARPRRDGRIRPGEACAAPDPHARALARAVRSVTAPVTAIVVTYREPELGRPAIASLERQTTPPAELLVIANDPEARGFGSSLPTRVIHTGGNLGYPGSCNVAAEQAGQPWLFFLNPDSEAAPDCLERLLEAADERTAIVGAQVLLPDGRVNAGDNPVHVTGLSWSGRYLEPAEHGPPRETAAVSGAALIARTDVFRELGGHCPAFFLYVDDTDMAWRARLAGWKVVFCPEAAVSHHYEFDKGLAKWRNLEHNRMWMVVSNYAGRTLALLAPLLLAAEAGIALQARRDGRWPQKREAWRDLIRGRRELARWRRRVQAQRSVGDRAIVARMQGEMHTPLVESPMLDRVNRWMELYRRAVLPLLRR